MAKTVKRFSEADFKEEKNRVSRMIMVRAQPNDFALNNRDSEYYDLLREVYPILCNSLPMDLKLQAIKDLRPSIWDNQLGQIIRDAQDLFLVEEDIHPRLLRGMMRNELLHNIEMLKKIRNDEDYDPETRIKAADSITKSWDRIAKYSSLDKMEEEADSIDPFRPFDVSEDITQSEHDKIQKLLETEDSIHE